MHSLQPDEHTIALFLDLVSISATSAKEKPVADYIRQRLENSSISVEEDDAKTAVQGSSGNLICRLRSGGHTMLSCHMDTPLDTQGVVPLRHPDRITSDGRTILGVDNRLGVTTLLRLLELAAAEPQRFVDFTVAFTVCEESTLGGSKALAFPPGIKQAFVFDSSLRPGHFIRGSFGAMTWLLNVHGRSSHAGLAPEKGINAIHIAAQIINRLPNGRVDDATTFNVAQLTAGRATNVVPDLARISGEIRSWKEQDVEDQVEELRQVAKTVCAEMGGTFDLEAEWVFEPFLIETDDPIIKRLETHYETLGLPVTSHIAAGGSDANSYNKRGLPALNLGIGAQNPHGRDEFVLLEDMAIDLQLAQLLVRKD